MADNKIRFEIGTFFNGDGLKQASSNMDRMTKTVSKVSDSFTRLSNEMDNKFLKSVGQTSSALGGLFGALASGNATIALLIANIGIWASNWSKYKTLFDDLNTGLVENDKLIQQCTGSVNRLMKSIEGLRVAKLNKEVAESTQVRQAELKAIKDVAEAYNALSQAQKGLSGSQSKLKIAKITEEFNSKLNKAATELERGVIEASKKLAIAQEESAEKARQLNEQYDLEKSILGDLNRKIELQKGLIDDLVKSGKDTVAAEDELTKLENQRNVQLVKMQKVETDLQTARVESTNVEKELNKALEESKRAVVEEKEAREDARRRIEDEAALRNALNEELEKVTTEYNLLNQKIKDEKKAIDDRIANAKKGKDYTEMGADADAKYHQGISGQGYDYSRDGNGTINDFVDWQRAQRYAQRAMRDKGWTPEIGRLLEKLENGGQLTDAEQQKLDEYTIGRANMSEYQDYKKIKAKQKAGEKLSDREKQKMKDWEDFMDQRNSKEDWQKIVDGITGQKSGNGKTLADLHDSMESIQDDIDKLTVK